jgi:DNA-binding NarL/FixJ family response regulator
MKWTDPSLFPPDVMADAQAVADAIAGRQPLDPEVARRVRERSERIQEKLLKEYGMREIAVDLIRQGREEE